MDLNQHHALTQRALELGRNNDPLSVPELADMLQMPSAEIRRLAASALAQLADFGAVAKRTIAFWLPASALTAAGQPLPAAGASVECTAPAALAGIYTLDAPVVDPTGTTLTLRCTAPAQ